eukprot:scaffold698_cov115-Skeletonema_dohrnii-CCMP3373.AAC.9
MQSSPTVVPTSLPSLSIFSDNRRERLWKEAEAKNHYVKSLRQTVPSTITILATKSQLLSDLHTKMMFLSSVQKSAALRVPVSALLRRQNSSFVSSKTALTVSNGRRLKQTTSLRSISQSPLLKAQITVNVPTMGDSITEGTIVEWCVPPGSNFREGDVLALVETDK